MKKLLQHKVLLVFLLSILLGMILIVPTIISGHGLFTFTGDYNAQQIPFNMYMNEAIKNGSYLWNWYNDLGSSFIGSFSLYNLTSPFTIILWLFPSSIVPYLMGPMFILKYGIAGVTAYLFLKRYVKNKNYAVIGALLYAFSGFQLTNTLFYHFHDVVAFFPLLLYSLDRLVHDNKKGLFAICVALNAITNYYFFIGQVVFVIVYYVVMLLTKQYSWKWKQFISIFIESVIGVLLAAFILLPSIYFVLGNPRVDGNWSFYSMVRPPGKNILEIIRGLIFPNDSMSYRSIISSQNFTSVETYLPFVGSILWLSYLIKKPKNSTSIFMFTLLIFMVVPILNSSFSAFTTNYYARWFYMAILIMSLLSIKTLDEKISIKSGVIATFGILFIFLLLSFYRFHNETFIYQQPLLIGIVIAFVLNVLGLILIYRFSHNVSKLLVVGIFLYIGFYGNYYLFYNTKDENAANFLEGYQKIGLDLQKYDANSRMNATGCIWNMGTLSNRMIVTSWNSNINGSSFDFYESLQIVRGVATVIPTEMKSLQDFLSIQYIFSCHGVTADLDKNYTLLEQTPNYAIYENKNYKPLGIDYSYYISKEEFETLSPIERMDKLNFAVVLDENQIQRLELKKYNGEKYETKLIANNFWITNSGYEAAIDTLEERFIVYSIPYDKGFKVTINGEEVPIINVDNGLIGFTIHKGKNNIKFKYVPPGLKMGICLSISGIFLYIGYVIINKRSGEKK